MNVRANLIMCDHCEGVFRSPRGYAKGEAYDCPICGCRVEMCSYALNLWYLTFMKPTRFVLKMLCWVMYGWIWTIGKLIKYAFQAALGIAVVEVAHGAFRMGGRVLHGEPPLRR